MNRRTALLLAGAILTATLLGGCALFSVLAYNLAGPPKADALYTLDPEQPTLVLVDDPSDKLPNPALANRIAGRVEEHLKDKKLVKTTIPSAKIEDLRARENDFKNWSIEQVAKELQATQVIYVMVQDFQLIESEETIRPTAAVRIKVLQIANAKADRKFPKDDPTGALLAVGMRYTDPAGATRGQPQMAANALSERLAMAISQAFYKHEIDETFEQKTDKLR